MCDILFPQAIRDSFGHHGNSSGIGSATFSSLEMDFAVAIFAIGGMLGALPAGTLADLLGRYVVEHMTDM